MISDLLERIETSSLLVETLTVMVIRMSTSSFDPSVKTPVCSPPRDTLNWMWRIDFLAVAVAELTITLLVFVQRDG